MCVRVSMLLQRSHLWPTFLRDRRRLWPCRAARELRLWPGDGGVSVQDEGRGRVVPVCTHLPCCLCAPRAGGLRPSRLGQRRAFLLLLLILRESWHQAPLSVRRVRTHQRANSFRSLRLFERELGRRVRIIISGQWKESAPPFKSRRSRAQYEFGINREASYYIITSSHKLSSEYLGRIFCGNFMTAEEDDSCTFFKMHCCDQLVRRSALA